MTIKAKHSGQRGRTSGTSRGVRNLHAEIAFKIGERICSGEFPSGSVLPNEAAWGKLFGASRTAVREGMKVLQAKGLVISRPKIGSRVAPRESWNLLDKDVFAWHGAAVGRKAFIATTQEFRRHIEPGIAELAALKRTPAQLEAMAHALSRMSEAERLDNAISSDVAFHRGLLAAANNELLNPFAVLIEQSLGSLFEFTTQVNPRYRQAIHLHERIFKAVKEQDSEGARKAMQALISDTDDVLSGERAGQKSKSKPGRS
ncbi:FadR/GntR family transcriptional regulator [Aestuariivirga litoralis]|uniref:FadR/GntR family transcriptional regulator n=1 Tax=Aestuariivirga litoralis TaxID=2650924 RepID=UPI0018C71454|nr:FadR/GntR family transcriptional regulator [Aestuariivirga litoralis]